MEVILIIVGLFFLYLCIKTHKSVDRSEEEFANRPKVINNPKTDLSVNQKFAIVRLYTFILGANKDVDNNFAALLCFNSAVDSLGISIEDAKRVIQKGMYNPDRAIEDIIDSISEIRDIQYIEHIKIKCDDLLLFLDVDNERLTLVVDQIFSEIMNNVRTSLR